MSKQLKELTRAEEEVMQALWKCGPAFVKDLLAEFPEPRPAYNTVSTIVRILERKGFVNHNAYGKTHQYFALISKDEYKSYMLKNLASGYFSGSFKKLVSFMTEENNLSLNEIEEIRKHLLKKDTNE